jgi:hypothetical protein
MKKLFSIMWFIIIASTSEIVIAAQCGTGTTQVINGQIEALLKGKFVCATRGSDTWRECHGTLLGTNCSNGNDLWDLKLGGNPMDPASLVGSWSRSGSIVSYNYGTGGTYSYEIYRIGTGSTYDFCGTSPSGNNVLIASIQSSPCP